jgi:hypothetical protein
LNFPETRFGICQVCGTDGSDQTAELTGADASARTASPGNGIELELYEGKLLCNVCINEAKARKETMIDVRKHAREEQFRAKAGFTNTI